MATLARHTSHSTQIADRRVGENRTKVLRVGLLSDGDRASYCLLRNISAAGAQIRTFVTVTQGDSVQFRVGDSEREKCRVAWARNHLAGLEFQDPVDPKSLLRTSEHFSLARRSSPRISAAAWATLRTGGRTFGAELCDISPTGVKIRTRKPLSPSSPALLTIPDLPVMRGFVCWNEGQVSGVMFEQPLPIPVIAKWVSERRRVNHDF